MRKVQSSEAEAHFAELLDDVERGETIVITRDGRDIARLAPEAEKPRAGVQETLGRIEAFRKGMPRLTVDEILSARHEGHKY
jgi:prevent-host-death family protein